MDTIVEEKGLAFKELEKEIFRMSCQADMEITRQILEQKDEEIFRACDKAVYHSEGFRRTSIKTVYGTVEYRRRVYRTRTDDGKKEYVYLLDEALGMEKIGLISENLAEKIADLATEAPYRQTAETVSGTTGISISAQGAWGMMQRLGERIVREEEASVDRMNAGNGGGTKMLPVLFEEMDGVWIRRQGKRHEKMPMQEVKVSTTYEGWDAEKEKAGRSTLTGKRVLAGIEGSEEFHAKREADIREHYDADEIGLRVVNGDGGSWIGEPNDPDAVVQLDPFHVHQEIRRRIAERDAQRAVEGRLEGKDIEGALEYISAYADSVDTGEKNDKRAKNARKLLRYLMNNKESLIPWRERGLEIPEPPEGIIYKGMGVQENQNCTVITLRMKHRRMRWSERGGNSMAKALYRKENRELHETIGRYSNELPFTKTVIEAIEALSAAKAPKKDGKGNPYVDRFNCHMPIMDAMLTEARKYFHRVSA